MAIYRGPGGAGDATADAASEASLIKDLAVEVQADADAAEAARAAAVTAQIAAELAETNAETAEANAETAETNAETAQAAAASSASAAATSATNAANSATAAQTAETNAETAETNAETAETNAAASASAASTSATNASNSASSASTSATNASNSATAAATSATNASNSATAAASSASAASTSATNAANSATAASGSATSASGSASTATTQAGIATTQATNASSSASAASTSASAASTSATNASNSASAASTSATNASNSASAAATSATNAANSATAADASADAAAISETNAAASAASINLSSIAITGGSINGTTIGASTPSTGAFTSLTSSSTTTLNGTTIPSSKTLVVTTDIGSTVQAYDADTAKLDVSQNWSASQSFNAGVTLGDASGDALTINSSAASIPNGLNFDSNTLVIDATNNRVGVGIANPTSALDVNGVATFSAGTVSAPAITTSGDTNTGIFFPAADTIAFSEGGVESMRIDSSGNVCIGATSAASRLHVAGSFRQTGATVPFEWTVNAGAADFYKLNAVGYADNLIVATSAGNVGIGTSSPGQKLQISNSSSSGFAAMRMAANARSYDVGVGGSASGFQQNNWYVYDVTGAATRLVIDSSGRVTMPFQPAFHATRDTAYNANGTVVVFPDVSVNIGSGYNSSNGRFTAPVAGTYIILVSFFTNITNAPIDFRITVNGGAVGGNATTGTTSVARDCHAYIIRTVSANDYIEVISQGYGMNIPGGLGIFQTFSGHLIG